jgi:mRNA interferase MazF
MSLPDQGDLVWVNFSPQSGHEQAGQRPALVVSPQLFHKHSPFAIVCPVTSQVKGRSSEVLLPAGLALSGAVLTDQVKSIDRHARGLRMAGRVPEEIIIDVLEKLHAFLGMSRLP